MAKRGSDGETGGAGDAIPSAAPVDILPPAEVARLVERIGVRKARTPLAPLFALSVLAGAFIGFGAMLFTVAVTDSALGYGVTRLIGGAAFSLGLILVIVGGAELFTGNNLLVMAWADGLIDRGELLRHWAVVYVGNAVGAIGLAALSSAAGALESAVGPTALRIAEAKIAMPWGEALARGVLCNVLVCLAVWMSAAAHSAGGKALMILFPITAFVALGFEHSVANMYLVPVAAFAFAADVSAVEFLANLAVVTIGNLIGGVVLVALTYWAIYRVDWR